MPDDDFQVDHLDHVSLTVPDRYEAARWYEDVLGLTVCEAYEPWAERDGGPLVVSSDGGHTMLALFAGEPADQPENGHLAFRTDGDGFLRFVERLAEIPDVSPDGSGAVVDHDLAFSVYFEDPYGHRFEVTTYDYDQVAAAL